MVDCLPTAFTRSCRPAWAVRWESLRRSNAQREARLCGRQCCAPSRRLVFQFETARRLRVAKSSTSFKPGRSGNSGGRPKAEVQALARTFTERAIKTLGEITEDVKAPPAARALAANALLDRAWGRDRSSLSCRLVTGVRQAQLWRRTSARFSRSSLVCSAHTVIRGRPQKTRCLYLRPVQ